jgi:hypothetical protein
MVVMSTRSPGDKEKPVASSQYIPYPKLQEFVRLTRSRDPGQTVMKSTVATRSTSRCVTLLRFDTETSVNLLVIRCTAGE